MFLLLFVILAILGQLTSAADKFKCTADQVDQFDVVTARIISFNEHQRKFPQTKAAVPQYCT